MGEVQYLSQAEIDEFVRNLDQKGDGFVDYEEVEAKLDDVHWEIAPEAKPHHLHHEDRDDEERHRFLRSILGTNNNRIPHTEFATIVEQWKIPSLSQDSKVVQSAKDYINAVPLGRRLRAYWSVQGSEIIFIALVVSLQIAFGVWQMVKYIKELQWRNALGWGVVLSKASAGALYPTMFFLIISMSRYLSTFSRKFYQVSKFINFDLSHAFHVKISIVALALATLHTIGHLTGTFLYGSRPAQEAAVAYVLGPDAVPRPYSAYVASLPGWTGLAAYGIFWVITLMSLPFVRKWSFEVFQLAHLLMFPMIGLLIAHGLEALLQSPMLGYWLALPTLLVVLERCYRFALGFHRIPATLDILDPETVCITAKMPKCRIWTYKAGQYLLLQVPHISFFQWHPFTISACIDDEIQIHIKTDGDWTAKLRELKQGPELESTPLYIGVDGPFGAPAQRFYHFNQSVIIGSGIGVTPFSGILTDLQTRADLQWKSSSKSSSRVRASSTEQVKDEGPTDMYRTVDFHWIVKDRNHLLWFSDLLNSISSTSSPNHEEHNPNLKIEIKTHLTQRRRNISTHVFRYLLEMHRTPEHPASPLTGLINPTHFGRPDLGRILDEHYDKMRSVFTERNETPKSKRRVGVFFCGMPAIGYELADRCRMLTLRGRQDGSRIEYYFMMEVF